MLSQYVAVLFTCCTESGLLISWRPFGPVAFSQLKSLCFFASTEVDLFCIARANSTGVLIRWMQVIVPEKKKD